MYFHCSTRRFWEPEFPDSDLNLAGWTKRLTGKPVITVGSVGLEVDFVDAFRKPSGADQGERRMERLMAMLEGGEVDLVAVGRALLVDPGWPAKVRAGRLAEFAPYSPDVLKSLV